jgi:predicted ATP-grasp superfamily ATP-dependent carboligase
MLNKVGMNVPYITYRELIGQPLAPTALKEDKNVVFWYGYEDMLAVRDYIKTGQLKPAEVFKSYFKKHAYAIWDWQDPVPAFSYAGMIAGKVMKKVTKK